jgi:DNA-binding NarL/FixJ family response regulator
VITDLNMPELSGTQLAGEIAGIRPEIPVILCTGFSEYIDCNRGKPTGIRRVLMKPLTMNELARAVREVLDV